MLNPSVNTRCLEVLTLSKWCPQTEESKLTSCLSNIFSEKHSLIRLSYLLGKQAEKTKKLKRNNMGV